MNRALPALLAPVLLLGSGCTAIPDATPPTSIQAGPTLPCTATLLVHTPEFSSEEAAKGYTSEEVAELETWRAPFVEWLETNGCFEALELARGDRDRALDDAWRRGDAVLVEVHLEGLRTRFEGHNLLWVPNLVNWVWWMIPAWFVPTEDYSLVLDAPVVVTSVDSGRELHRGTLSARADASFNEFDRGWQFFGFLYPSNEAENWRQITTALLPATLSQLARGLVQELDGPLRARLDAPAARALTRKHLGLVVGVGDYRDDLPQVPRAHASDDARRVRAVWTDGGLDPRWSDARIGAEASTEAILEALEQLSERARDGDRVTVYWAGGTAPTSDGDLELLCYDLAEDGSGRLRLSHVLDALAALPADVLWILDGPLQLPDDWAPPAGVTVLCAGDPGAEAITPDGLGSSLFAHHLALAWSDPQTDRDDDRRLTASELLTVLRPRFEADAAYLGFTQRPRGWALDVPWSWPLPTTAEPDPDLDPESSTEAP